MPFRWGDQPPPLPGERVALRSIEREDGPGLLAIFGDPQVVRFWSRPPLADLDAAVDLIDEIQEAFLRRRTFQWGIREVATGELIGTIAMTGVSAGHRRAEIGFVLRRDRWGQGLASAALRLLLTFCYGPLGLHRVEADVDPENDRCLRLLERIGFRREGYLRERWLTGDQWRDAIFLGLLRADWRG